VLDDVFVDLRFVLGDGFCGIDIRDDGDGVRDRLALALGGCEAMGKTGDNLGEIWADIRSPSSVASR
jgi:hypothetical protein